MEELRTGSEFSFEQQGPMGACEWERDPDPCLFVIFGASGDLCHRKLMPALYNLFSTECLPSRFCILGASRTPMSDQIFRDSVLEAFKESGQDLSVWDAFCKRVFYQPLQYDDPGSYLDLGGRIKQLDHELGIGGCCIYSMAIPPRLYGAAARHLGLAGLSAEQPEKGQWTRLVVEKPFGTDLATAQALNRAIAQGFGEHQVFRIDHYMAKETVQNILMLRFANAIFEPLWNRNYIDHVRINAGESLGVGHRAGYYEQSGVIRDMLQNHMMQLLALVAAEPPSVFNAGRVRDKQAELFRSLRPVDMKHLGDHLVLGQYAPAAVDGEPAPGYLQEPGVGPESTTPTYALLKVFVDNWRWQGVPFYLTSGKGLKRKTTAIDIQFKRAPHSMFRHNPGVDARANRLVLGIYPKEEIFITFQAKRPGPQICLRTAGLRFSYRSGRDEMKLDAYAKALLDTMAGDQTLFWRQDCLELCWAFYDPILKGMETCTDDLCSLHHYPAGSLGPHRAIELLPSGSWPEKPD